MGSPTSALKQKTGFSTPALKQKMGSPTPALKQKSGSPTPALKAFGVVSGGRLGFLDEVVEVRGDSESVKSDEEGMRVGGGKGNPHDQEERT